jgi:hypothetical protein
VTQHYLQLPYTWGHLHCALPSVGILYNYTYSACYHRQLQNSSHHFRVMPFVSIIFEWPSTTNKPNYAQWIVSELIGILLCSTGKQNS